MRRAWWLVALLGCDEGAPSADGVADAARADAALTDAAVADAGPLDAGPLDAGWQIANRLPPADQPVGDPALGREILLTGNYVGCGIPLDTYLDVVGPAPAGARLPGRAGINAELPYVFNSYTSESGVDLVTANCLSCHAGRIDGELIVGLGSHASDFTGDASGQARALGALIDDPAARAEYDRWAERTLTIAPFIRTRTIGANPADNLGLVLFAHRDPETLAWSDEPLMALPPTDPVPVDVPPWWHMRKKAAMYWNAMGEGQHGSLMMTASTLCVDTVEEAERIRDDFVHVAAWIRTLEPPAWKWTIDEAQAIEGQQIFEATCAPCHGTYGPDGAYPNLWVPIDVIGTDPALAIGAADRAGIYQDWYNASFYGQAARLDAKRGYIAPPLDGIWATAPYFHNGSVPTLAGVLDSTARPTYFKRSFDSRDYDREAVGWQHEVLDYGHDARISGAERKTIYDTTLEGYGNGGHPFGDHLDAADRAAVIEYLKTL